MRIYNNFNKRQLQTFACEQLPLHSTYLNLNIFHINSSINIDYAAKFPLQENLP